MAEAVSCSRAVHAHLQQRAQPHILLGSLGRLGSSRCPAHCTRVARRMQVQRCRFGADADACLVRLRADPSQDKP